MDLEFSTEQELLRDSADRMFGQLYTQGAHRTSTSGFRRANWRSFAELGLLALPFSHELGGLGGASIDLQIVMETAGKHLAGEPYVACAIQPAVVLNRLGAPHLWQERVSRIIEGRLVAGFAHDEEGNRHGATRLRTHARKQAGGFSLSGRKLIPTGGLRPDAIIASARLDSSGDVALYIIETATPGVQLTAVPTFDGSEWTVVDMADVIVPDSAVLLEGNAARAAISAAEAQSTAAVCGEAVGLMDAMLWETVSYIKTRSQFGGPLSRFQALQHRSAEMYVALEQARSMALLAAMSASSPDERERSRSISAAKVQINASLRFVGQQAVQLHGGIGVTEECAVGQRFKRTTMLERMCGDTFHHMNVLDRCGGLEGRLPTTIG